MAIGQDTDLLTVAEAAQALKVSRITLSRWLKAGRLPSYRVGPRAIRIRRSDLETMLTPLPRAAAPEMSETQPILTAPRPMTQAAADRQRQAYEAILVHIEQMRAHYAGIPRAESWPMIREAREERSGLDWNNS